MKTLILYSSRNGQTEKIARSLEQHLAAAQIKAELRNLHETSQVDLAQYQQVVIGASIRYGHFHSSLGKFVKQHYQALNAMPAVFFAVNLTARKAEKRTPQTNIYTKKFLQKSPWQPDLCQVFAGAVRYPQYLWYQKLMVRLIMTMTGGETDTSKEVEYTDWQQVAQFAGEIAALTSDQKGKTAEYGRARAKK